MLSGASVLPHSSPESGTYDGTRCTRAAAPAPMTATSRRERRSFTTAYADYTDSAARSNPTPRPLATETGRTPGRRVSRADGVTEFDFVSFPPPWLTALRSHPQGG